MFSLLASTNEHTKLDWRDAAAAIPITVIIGLWIWSARRKKSKAKTLQRFPIRPTAPRPSVPKASDPTKPSPDELADGDYFLKCLFVLKEIPPPGPAFINLFFHGDPTDFDDEWQAVRDEASDEDFVRDSLDKLRSVLDRIARDGAPLPVIEAAAEAVTMNLTALAVCLAANIVERRPDISDLFDPDIARRPDWHDDPEVDQISYVLRNESSAIDYALVALGSFARRPGDCLRAAVTVMDRSFDRLVGMTVAEVFAIVDLPRDSDESSAHQNRRMAMAMEVAKSL